MKNVLRLKQNVYVDSSTNTDMTCYLKSWTGHVPQTCSGSVLESGLTDPLASIPFHHCKIQPDVSIKALSSLKLPQFCQRWRVSRVSGGKVPPLPGLYWLDQRGTRTRPQPIRGEADAARGGCSADLLAEGSPAEEPEQPIIRKNSHPEHEHGEETCRFLRKMDDEVVRIL